MALLSISSPYLLLLLPLIYYLLPYLCNRSLRHIPGPPLARFSNLWLLYHARRGQRYLAVDAAHKKYGPLVRIQPDHVSIADPDAIPIVYSHTGGWIKSDFYDAFVTISRAIFTTRNRAEHTRKRKILSHTFSAKSVSQFEPYIASNLREMVKQWHNLSDKATQAGQPYAEIDALDWFNYLAFDIIGDLAFGAPFGMLPRGLDITEIRLTPTSPPTTTSAIHVLNTRGSLFATLGCLPSLKPFASLIPDPFFRRGLSAVSNLAGIAHARVNERITALKKGERVERNDILARLMEARDESGEKLGREEVTGEALGQIVAGSDTTSNTLTAVLYWCLRTEGVMEKLREEVDGVMAEKGEGVDCVLRFKDVKDLPHLHMVINETLRHHSPASLGLPRLVPPSSPPITIHTHTFPPLTTLSIPTYTLHTSPTIWGPTAHLFDPLRWSPERITELQKRSFMPFGVGPRACIGRNVAEMEVGMVVARVVGGFEILLLEEGGGEWETREGFLRKGVSCRVGVRRRRVRGKEGGN
ncbi:MAG: hypothetical protein Q9169_006226 [Polycauliona sp. 2 TL-2023]